MRAIDTTPPKQIISKELRLFEANCVPSAVLHFGSEDKRTNYLKEELFQKVSSAKASLKQALADRCVDFLRFFLIQTLLSLMGFLFI